MITVRMRCISIVQFPNRFIVMPYSQMPLHSRTVQSLNVKKNQQRMIDSKNEQQQQVVCYYDLKINKISCCEPIGLIWKVYLSIVI